MNLLQFLSKFFHVNSNLIGVGTLLKLLLATIAFSKGAHGIIEYYSKFKLFYSENIYFMKNLKAACYI